MTYGVTARVPTTLQPLDDKDEIRRAEMRRCREMESQKWDSIRKEVEDRRLREKEQDRTLVDQANKQRIREGNCEIRDEITKQLDRSVANDWKYQIDLKKQREQEEILREEAFASQERQIIEDKDRAEQEQTLRKQRQMHHEREEERNEKLEEKFKGKMLTQALHRLENTSFKEDSKLRYEEEVAAYDRNQEAKKEKRDQFLNHIQSNAQRELLEKYKENLEHQTTNEENQKLKLSHEQQLELEKKKNAKDVSYTAFDNRVIV